MRGEQAIFNLEIKKKSGLSINPDIHHSKVFSSACTCRGSIYKEVFDKTEDFMPYIEFLNTFSSFSAVRLPKYFGSTFFYVF